MKEKGNFKEILKLIIPHKGMASLVIVGVLLQSAINLFWPVITKYILNNLLNKTLEDALNPLIKCLWIMIGVIILNIFTQWILTEKASILTDKIKYKLEKDIFSKYMNMSFSYFDNIRSGAIINLINYDIERVDEFIYVMITRVLKIIITIIGAICLFYSISVKITCIFVPLLLLSFIISNIHEKYLFKSFNVIRDKNKLCIEEAEDKIYGVRTIVSFAREYEEECRFSCLCEDTQEASKKTWMHTWIRDSIWSVFDNTYYVIFLIFGGIMTLKSMLSIADISTIMIYSYLVLEPVKDIMDILKIYNKANVSFAHIHEFLNKKPDIISPKNHIYPNMKEGNIVFDNVSFHYNGNEENVIDKLSMTIEGGKHTAIVGLSGSGKSTIAGLIPRYYDVTNGNISIDGINVKDIDLKFMRSRIGVVQQDIYLFYGSVFDNIAYTNPCCNAVEVIRAAKLANAHEFISNLPDGYNTIIGERGIKLSGGQKQRIAIARVLLANPPIIIFDEATSSLDNESEKEVQKAIDNIAGTRTMLTITHRLSTIKNADDIIYLSKEGIEERGTHYQLIEKDGKYAKLYTTNEMCL